MQIPENATLDPAWYDVIRARTSRRSYDGRPVPDDAMARLRTLAAEFRPFPDVRVDFIRNPDDNVFVGLGSYGRIDGAPSAIVLSGVKGAGTGVGYTGEALVLEATRSGVGSCWVAGTFRRRRTRTLVDLDKGQRVICVVSLGIPVEKVTSSETGMRRLAGSDRRKPIEQIAPGIGGGNWPDWAVAAIEAARLAPSGSNKQPWRFDFADGALVLACPSSAYFTASVDRGIAMLHAELGAMNTGVTGHWHETKTAGTLRLLPDGP